MEELSGILGRILKARHGTDLTSLSFEDAIQRKADQLNATDGTLTGFSCPVCHNRGFVAFVKDGNLYSRECECMRTRRSLNLIEKSGLKPSLEAYTFESFQTPERWQEEAKRAAVQYLTDKNGAWLLMSGTVGSGKTHLCTVICGELLKSCVEVRYMKWRDDSVRLKANVNAPDYEKLIRPYKTVKTLYIDDFFKGGSVTAGDINLAFEILNTRYTDKNLITILSTEKTIPQLMEIDAALATRIYERCKGYCICISGESKNWRLRT
ncbi:MAG: ATP-binding protein [Intestinimonas sp.]|jgi:DNA replication protein DnaC|nr:ATP-binding protein [Intestinimonas sp.]